ncbi:putative choline transporter, neither null mutation nor overexpression affects choline transport [Borealophlyctis nickersoniae]|nr:putative choline transporter, neither null mutation nor overexpression affects choline transport [Borealophlyctis nickersoniae]
MAETTPVSANPPFYDLTDKIGLLSDVKKQETDIEEESYNFRFAETRKPKDRWAAALFGAQFGVALVLNTIGVVQLFSILNPKDGEPLLPVPNEQPYRNAHPALYILPSAAVFAAFTSIFLYQFLRFHTNATVVGSIYAIILAHFAVMILSFLAGATSAGLYFMVPFIVFFVLTVIVKDRVEFAVALLESVTSILNPNMVLVSCAGFLVEAAYAVFALAGMAGFVIHQMFETDDGHVGFKHGTKYAIVYLVASAYWTMQMVPNMMNVILSGAFASHYYAEGGEPSMPIRKATARAMTTSFGSVALGSLVIVAAQAVHYIVGFVTRAVPFIGACMNCGLGFIIAGLQYFNTYAFTHVAIYGKPYVQSAQDTYALFKDSGMTVISNDVITYMCSFALCHTVGLVTAFLGFFWAVGTVRNYYDARGIVCIKTDHGCTDAGLMATDDAFAIGGACWAIGVGCMHLITRVVRAGVTTTIVIVAEDHEMVKRNHPTLYKQVKETYPAVAAKWEENTA